MPRISFKLCVFGDAAVGKTTLIKKYTTGVFDDSMTTTLGLDFSVKKFEIADEFQISLQLWDFMGEERFRVLLPGFVSGAEGALFIFDITRYKTFKNLEQWLEVLKECIDEEEHPIPIILVGSKLDLAENRSVDPLVAEEMVAQNKMFFLYTECSAKTGENVDLIFTTLARKMLKKEKLI